jgi:hypothetical protein
MRALPEWGEADKALGDSEELVDMVLTRGSLLQMSMGSVLLDCVN